MSVIVLHRQKGNPPPKSREEEPQGKNQGGRKKQQPERRTSGFSNFKYSLKDSGKSLILKVEALFNGKKSLKGNLSIPKTPWTQYSIYFSGSLQKFIVVDFAVITPAVRSLISEENYIGKAVSTDTETLLYLRGRIPNIAGFKNVIVDADKSSMDVIANVSPKARRFIEKTVSRQLALSRIDTFKYFALLEAQVDLLTKVILESNLPQNKNIKVLLSESLKLSSALALDGKALQNRLQYKKVTQSIKD